MVTRTLSLSPSCNVLLCYKVTQRLRCGRSEPPFPNKLVGSRMASVIITESLLAFQTFLSRKCGKSKLGRKQKASYAPACYKKPLP